MPKEPTYHKAMLKSRRGIPTHPIHVRLTKAYAITKRGRRCRLITGDYGESYSIAFDHPETAPEVREAHDAAVARNEAKTVAKLDREAEAHRRRQEATAQRKRNDRRRLAEAICAAMGVDGVETVERVLERGGV